MQVRLDSSYGIIVIPETEFEKDYISKNFREHPGKVARVFIKHGASLSEMVGLKIYMEEQFVQK